MGSELFPSRKEGRSGNVIENFIDGIGTVIDGERIGLEWDEGVSLSEKLQWLETAARELGIDEELHAVIVGSVGAVALDDTGRAVLEDSRNLLQDRLWRYVQAQPAEAVGNVAGERTISSSTPARRGSRPGNSEVSVRTLAEELKEELVELDQQVAILPPAYYAHQAAKQLLRKIAPPVGPKIEVARQGQAVQALIGALGELMVLKLTSPNSAKGATPETIRRWSITALLRVNGYGTPDLVHVPDILDAQISKDDISVLNRQDWSSPAYEMVVGNALRDEDSVPPFESFDDFLAKLPRELHEVLDSHMTTLHKDEVVVEPQRRLLHALFPRRTEQIDRLTYERMAPLMAHIVGAAVAAQYIHAIRSEYPQIIRMAKVFVDRFFFVAADEIIRRNDNLELSRVSKFANIMLSQLGAYNEADRDDLFCAALGLARAERLREDYGQQSVVTKVSHNISRAPLMFAYFYPAAGVRSDAAPARPMEGSSASPARLRTRPPKRRVTAAPPAASAEAWSAEGLLATLDGWDVDMPLSDEVVAQIRRLFPGRFGLTPDERRLVDAVCAEVTMPGGRVARRQSLEMVGRQNAYRDYSPEQFRLLLKTTVDKLSKAAGHTQRA